MMETIYTVSEVAKALKISRSKIYLLIQRKEIPHLKIGRNVRITESQLQEWIQNNREEKEPYSSWR